MFRVWNLFHACFNLVSTSCDNWNLKLINITSSVYGTLLWTLWLLLVKHFYVTCYICLTCIIMYGLYCYWLLFLIYIYIYIYICGTFSSLSICYEFFFSCIYLCYFYCYICYIFFETCCHIILVINSNLIISYDILKNIFYKTNILSWSKSLLFWAELST